MACYLNKNNIMKKIILLAVVFFGVKSVSAQMIVDAEMFKANPTQFMGKVVVIKNPVFKGSSMTPGSPQGGAVSSPSGSAGATDGGAPTGVAGPSSGKSASVYCNPAPNFTLTKWTLGPNNDICVQVDAKLKPMVDMCQVGSVVKSISFRVTPSTYVATRIEK